MTSSVTRFTLFLALALNGLLAASASAAVVTAGTPFAGSTDWLHNWNNATVSDGTFLLPAASVPDTAIINQNRTVNVNNAVSIAAGTVVVNNTNGNGFTADLNINGGGSLTTGSVVVAGGTDPGTLTVQGGTLNTTGILDVNATGTVNVTSGLINSTPSGSALQLDGGVLNISGGSVVLNDPAPGGGTFTAVTGSTPGTINLTGGTLEFAGSTAATDTISIANDVYNISGGTLSACGGQFISSQGATSPVVFNISGSTSTVELDRMNLANTARAADFNFVMDAAGVTPVTNCTGTFGNVSFADITVDGSSYAGPTTVGTFIPLFTYANMVGTQPAYSVTGLGAEGVDWDFVFDTTTNMVGIEFLSPVPEPSSLALLLPCLALLGLSRRKRR